MPPPDQPRKSFDDRVCTPGSVMIKPSGLRPRVGVSSICLSPIAIERSELSVATWTVEASTAIDVVTSPTSSLMSCRSTLSCAATTIDFCVYALKPGCAILRLYEPGTTPKNTKLPLLSVVNECDCCERSPVNFTAAPATTAPLVSV